MGVGLLSFHFHPPPPLSPADKDEMKRLLEEERQEREREKQEMEHASSMKAIEEARDRERLALEAQVGIWFPMRFL